MSARGLQRILDLARIEGDVDPKLFAMTVFAGEKSSACLLGQVVDELVTDSNVDAQDFVRAAIAVLREAVEVNPDEAQVLRWFSHERLSAFAGMTPAEAIAAGHSQSLLQYVQSLDAGWTG
jgi:hypothetical protein